MNGRDGSVVSFLLFGIFHITVVVHAWADETQPVDSTPTAPLSRPPIHRYSFDGQGGDGAVLTDSIGDAHGQIYVEAPPKPLPYHHGSTTLVVIPDTEVYANKQPQTFNTMLQWIADNQEKRNIGYVLHVGDITNNNAEHEWENARRAFDIIEGKIPYVLAAGNHDYDHTPGRLTYMNDYFKVQDQKKWPTFGDVYEPGKLENHYQFLEFNGQKWIVLSLEMGPRKEVVAWANKVLEQYKDRLAIILTHGYLYYGNERYDHTKGGQRASPYNFYGEGADGEMMWNQLVRKHANVMMVICGHLSSQYVGYRKDEADHGNIVHQMLVDYEKMRGGYGFLRVLEFLPDGKTVQVRAYSPVTKQIRSPITRGDDPLQDPKLEEFVFELQAAPGEESRLATGTSAKPLEKTSVDAENRVEAPEAHIRLNGQGQLVIDANDGKAHGKLYADLVKGREEVSFEVWFTPAAESYGWDPVVHFGGNGDAFYYTFRTFNTHRAELIVDGHNEDIQRSIDVKMGQPLHVVVTYDQDGHDGRPLLCSYVDGKLTGQMVTGIKLSELGLTSGRIGPFAGEFDELRVYDRPLTAAEVAGNFKNGPDKLLLAGGVRQPQLAASAATPAMPEGAGGTDLRRGPIHRYSFDGQGGDGAVLKDSIGDADGRLRSANNGARLNGQGQLVIDANDTENYGLLDATLVRGRQQASVEVWVTPTAEAYQWDNVFIFGDMQGGIWYALRTLSVHRAEISVGGHNEDIQNKGVTVEVGRPLHIVWTYDQTGADGTPLLSCFRNGKLSGTLRTGIKLSELSMRLGRIGPFAGQFDELRVYDYPLGADEVRSNYAAGPDEVNLAE